MKKFSAFLAKISLLSFFFLAVAPVALPAISADAFASSGSITSTSDNNVLFSTLCNVLKVVTGSAGKAFAAFAIISAGVGFFTGKISWGLMIGITAGIAAMFGAPSIVSAITGKSAFKCEGTLNDITG